MPRAFQTRGSIQTLRSREIYPLAPTPIESRIAAIRLRGGCNGFLCMVQIGVVGEVIYAPAGLRLAAIENV